MEGPTKQTEALEIAFTLFLRFGYRKTSMDQIANAVGLSRQGLYLWFESKQALFVAMVDHQLELVRIGIDRAFAEHTSIEDQVVAAFVAQAAALVEAQTQASAFDELLEASARLLGDRVAQHKQGFLDRLASELSSHASDGLGPGDLAQVLCAISDGTKYQVQSVAEYERRMRLGVRAVLKTDVRV